MCSLDETDALPATDGEGGTSVKVEYAASGQWLD